MKKIRYVPNTIFITFMNIYKQTRRPLNRTKTASVSAVKI